MSLAFSDESLKESLEVRDGKSPEKCSLCWPLKSQERVNYFQCAGEEPLGAKDLIPTITRK